MRILNITIELAQSISKGFGLFLSERGNYVDSAYTPGLKNHKKS